MYKLIAVDIDGTLLNSEKVITPKTLSALLSAQKKRARLAIATGRPPKAVENIACKLRLEEFGGYVIGFNGATILSAQKQWEVIYRRDFPTELLTEICEIVKGRKVGISSYEGDEIIVGNYMTEYALRNSRMLGLKARFIDSMAQYVNFPVGKCLFSGEPQELAWLKGELESRFGDRLAVFNSESFLLEAVAAGVDKGSALRILAQEIGAGREECMAFGDNDNDIPILKYAGLGVAMGNSSQNAKLSADLVTLSNDEDGIAEVLNRYFV